jgi:hypothetical protein
MAEKYVKRLVVGNIDTYTYTVNSTWLGEETITAHDVTVDAAELTKNSSAVDGNVIGVSLTAVTTGGHQVHFEWTTSGGRKDCKTVILVCVDTCL